MPLRCLRKSPSRGTTTPAAAPSAMERAERRTGTRGVGHVRTRGSTAATTMSATTFETMTAIENSRKSAWSSGTSGPPDRLEGQQAQPGPAEDRLDRDGARDDEADVEEDQRDGRQQRVGYGVPAADHLVAQPLGPGGRQVVLPVLVEQRGAHDQRVLREIDQGQRRDGQEEVPGVSQMPCEAGRVDAAECMPPLGKMPGNGPTPVENTMSRIMPSQNSGIAVEHQRDRGRLLVEPAASASSRLGCRWHADDRGQDRRRAEEQDGRPDVVADDVPHRPAERAESIRSRTGSGCSARNCSHIGPL